MTCDVHIWMSGFVGEGVGSGSALVVKSHNSKQFSYDKNCSGSNSVIIATIQYHMLDAKVNCLTLFSSFHCKVHSCYPPHPKSI